MPNKLTPILDAVEITSTSVHFFDAIWGPWTSTKEQLDKWGFICFNGISVDTPEEIKVLFWAFIAELSDQDLEECFQELFPPSPSQSQE